MAYRGTPLAAPHRRILAALADLLVIAVCGFVLVEGLGLFPEAAEVFFLTLYVMYHGAFSLRWRGQSPGQKLMGIGVVTTSLSVLSESQSFGRPLVRVATYWIVGMLLNTYHFEDMDLLPGLTFAAAWPTVEILLLYRLPTRQTLADLCCQTLVVNVPPVQPHRAPAGPMYSADDVEFGGAPRGGPK